MTSWPATLPQSPLAEGFTETAPATALRTEMDQGPAKSRQRTTAGPRRLGFSLFLTRAQTATLDSFFNDDTKGGAVAFTFPHPRTGVSMSCRFTEPPRYQMQGGDIFRATLSLEVLP